MVREDWSEHKLAWINTCKIIVKTSQDGMCNTDGDYCEDELCPFCSGKIKCFDDGLAGILAQKYLALRIWSGYTIEGEKYEN